MTLNERGRGLRLAREVARFVAGGTGLLTFGAALVGTLACLRAGSATADTQYVIAPGSFKGGRLGELDDFPGMTIGCWQMRPRSRGSVQARSPDPAQAPVIQPRHLSDPVDREAVIEGLRFGRPLAHAAALEPYRGEELVPGAGVTSDAALLDYARSNGSTVYHAVSMCRMGQDDGAVVDSQLRVRGLANLRVIDASVMPTITSSKTNATTIMIAEKGAGMMAAAHAA